MQEYINWRYIIYANFFSAITGFGIAWLTIIIKNGIDNRKQKKQVENEKKYVLTMVRVELDENSKRVEKQSMFNQLLSTSSGELLRVTAVKINISPKPLKSILKVYEEFYNINNYNKLLQTDLYTSASTRGKLEKEISELKEECKVSINEALQALK